MVKLNLPRTCYCISLRTGSIVIGFATLVLTILLFSHSLMYTLVKGRVWTPNPFWEDITLDVFRTLKMEYTVCIQLIFACYLLYGLFMSKTWFILSWVVLQISALLAVLINCLIYLLVYRIMFADDLITLGLIISVIVTVYGYYHHKPEATFAYVV